MDQTAPLQQVTDILKKQGQTDDQITEFVNELTKAAFTRLYGNLMANLSDEDVAAIELCKDQEEANAKIKELYQKQTGKNPEDEIKEQIDGFAKDFIAENSKPENTPQSSTETPPTTPSENPTQ